MAVAFVICSDFLIKDGGLIGRTPTLFMFYKGSIKQGVEDGDTSPTCVYILGLKDLTEVPLKSKEDCEIIGYYNVDSSRRKRPVPNQRCWIEMSVRDKVVNIDKITINSVEVSSSGKDPHQILCFLYDDKVLHKSELLLESNGCTVPKEDHFKVLVALLKARAINKSIVRWPIVQFVLSWALFIVAALLKRLSQLHFVIKYSALGSHIFLFLESLQWALESMITNKRVTVKVGSYIVATLVDICGGIISLHLIMNYVAATRPLSEHLLGVAEIVVQSLRELLVWLSLSGSPAGLKLNDALNEILGQFFFYHINLWRIFLLEAKPVLELMFQLFLYVGRLGLTFQAAILVDLLALVSFHVYSIYVYVARLYYLQVSGLVALWRLFLGRKWNPLRDRVDSCKYTPNQLFVGTLAFTILLFLLPTTLVYYVVFTTMRLTILATSGILNHARYAVRAQPLYATFHWLMRSTVVCSALQLKPRPEMVRKSKRLQFLVLSVTPTLSSWYSTVRSCVPETVKLPPVVNFQELISKLVSGNLVLP